MKMTIGKKIVTGFSIVLIITTCLGVFSFWKVKVLESKANVLADDAMPGLQAIAEIDWNVAEGKGLTFQHILESDPARIAVVDSEIARLLDSTNKSIKTYEDAISDDEDRKNFKTFQSLIATYRGIRQEVLTLSRANKNEDAIKLVHEKLDSAYKALAEQVDVMSRWNTEYGKKASEHSREAASAARLGISVGLGIALFVGVAVAAYIILGTKKSLAMIADTLGMGSSQVRAAAQQISASGQSLAQGTSEQAASVEETSAAIEEMNSMIKNNAEASQQASTKSTAAKDASDHGTQAMTKMSTAIADIERSATETAKIIKVIDEIAFQTNLLALNAAVEAARAGEAGKGFAVVAEEVRNLAMRSAEAAKNTNQLIEQSVNNARNGVTISQDVAKSLEMINKSVGDVTSIIDSIASACREQTSGIDQISRSISQIEKVTQSTAANAEESAAASEELSAQSEQLATCVHDLQDLIGLKNQSGDVLMGIPVQKSAESSETFKLSSEQQSHSFSKAA